MNKLDRLVNDIMIMCESYSVRYDDIKMTICQFSISCELDVELREQRDNFIREVTAGEQE